MDLIYCHDERQIMEQQSLINRTILNVLKPLVRMLLRNNIPYGAFADLARRAYIDVATKEFTVEGRKQSNSRIATITGLSRKEVKRIQELDEEPDNLLIEKYNRAARVVYGWVNDKSYQDESDRPLALTFEGKTPSFSSLVKAYSGDVPPRAILDELKRVEVVTSDEHSNIHLLSHVYTSKTGINEKISHVGSDVSALLNTIDRNIYQPNLDPFFQRKICFNDLPEKLAIELQKMVAKESQEMLTKLDQAIAQAQHHANSNPTINSNNRNSVGIGIYYFENDDSLTEDEETNSA